MASRRLRDNSDTELIVPALPLYARRLMQSDPDTAHAVHVVDDDDHVRTALRRFLRACGFAGQDFSSGNDFLAEMQAPGSGCLVLDFNLPGLNGLEVLRHVQSRGWILPVIIVTGSADASVKEQVLQSGAWAFLKKPVDPLVLLSTIEKAIRDQRTSCESAATMPTNPR
jgi:FixJ family two-component response regulator